MLLPISEIIKKSWELYGKNFKKFIPYILVSLIPNLVLGIISLTSLRLDDYAKTSAFVSVNNLIVLAVTVAGLIFSLWLSIALHKNIREIIYGRPSLQIKNALSMCSHLIFPVFYTMILSFLIIFGGMILLIIPGIIFSIWYAFVYYAVIFEEKAGITALRFSRNMVRNRWWAIFGRLFIVGLFFGLIIWAIAGLLSGGATILVNGQTDKKLIDGAISVLVSAITTPLTALAGIIIYLNAKENPIAQPAVLSETNINQN